MPPDRSNRLHATAGSLATPPLFGRSRERDVLQAALTAAQSGHGQFVLVGGEAGIGKTSLVGEFIHTANLASSPLIAACHDGMTTPPYGPWLDLFASCERHSTCPPIPDAFKGGYIARITDQMALYADVCRFFGHLSEAQPAVVFLEDVHWADHASVNLLRQVVQHLDEWRLLIIATHRSTELSPELPFSHQLPMLIREAQPIRLHLDPLDTEDLHALVATQYATMHHRDQHKLVEYLQQHTDGNPLFVIELLRSLEEDRVIRSAGDSWNVDELDHIVVPALIRQLINSRATRLGETTRKALAIAAVVGVEVPCALWSTVAELSEDELIVVIERAVNAHLIEASEDGTWVRFVHALTREAMYTEILPTRRNRWHQQIATILMSDPDPDPDTVADHLQQSRDPRAWQWLERAADRAQRAYAWITAAERLRAAASLIEGIDGQEETFCRLVFRIAYLLRFADTAASIDALDEATHVVKRIGNLTLAAEMQHIRGFHLHYADRIRDGREEMSQGLAVLEALPLNTLQDSEPLARFADASPVPFPIDEQANADTLYRLHESGIDFRRAIYLWVQAVSLQLEELRVACERFLSLFDHASPTNEFILWQGAFVHLALGNCYAELGDPVRARRELATSRKPFDETHHFVLIAIVLLSELQEVALTFEADSPSLRRRLAAEAASALNQAGGALRPGVTGDLARLACLVVDGRWSEADGILRNLPPPGNIHLRRQTTWAEAVLARHRGDSATVWKHLEARLPNGPQTGPGNSMLQEGLFLQRLAAETHLDNGDLPTAHTWLTAHDAWLAWSKSVLGQADGATCWARYHLEVSDLEAAQRHSLRALELATAPRQPLVLLAAHRLCGRIASLQGRFDDAESEFSAALQIADACEAPFERALIFVLLAESRLAAGALDDVRMLLDEARSILGPLNAHVALNFVDSLASRLDVAITTGPEEMVLTEREREVLTLLALGRSNQDIADELFVSRETARTHVSNIFHKLDVHSRAEAVDQAHRLGLLARR
jgi:DNA-binding CsgD family transcriptional regulator